MAPVLDDSEFWLERQFLAEKTDTVVGRGAMWKTMEDVKISPPRKEFPYEFGMWSESSSPVESLLTNESEEEDFFAELTRRLTYAQNKKFAPLDLYETPEVPKVGGGSPQSILGGIGSWSGRLSNGSSQSPIQRPSPPATPYESEYDTWGLIHAAAGQIEKLKVNAEAPPSNSFNGQFRSVCNSRPELNRIAPVQNHHASYLAEQQLKLNLIAAARRAQLAALLYEERLQILSQSEKYANSGCGLAPELLTQSAWPPLQQPQQRQPSVQSVPLPKKESVGTGVFLPRRYVPAPTPPRKRFVPSAAVPTKVAQEMCAPSQHHYSAYPSSLSQQNYEALMARRNASFVQQPRRVSRADEISQSNLEVCLPQEWSY